MKEAERLAWNYGYEDIAVISAVGTREYYKKNGYRLYNTYMVKKIENTPIKDGGEGAIFIYLKNKF